MIFNQVSNIISPIALSILLIAYLMVIELGNKKLKKILLPIIISLFIIFAIIFVQDILSKW
jgi:Na+/glutamate symporter